MFVFTRSFFFNLILLPHEDLFFEKDKQIVAFAKTSKSKQLMLKKGGKKKHKKSKYILPESTLYNDR